MSQVAGLGSLRAESMPEDIQSVSTVKPEREKREREREREKREKQKNESIKEKKRQEKKPNSTTYYIYNTR